MRRKVVYLASQNSTGVHKQYLLIDSDGSIWGDEMLDGHRWQFLPPAIQGDVRDWRICNLYTRRQDAVDAYRRLEQSRIQKASVALANL